MFGDSPFQNAVPAFQLPVERPDVDPFFDANYTVCFNEKWLKYIVTCLFQLTLQSTWIYDTPDELNLVQARAMTLISMFIQGCKKPPENIGNDTGIENMIRQNPDNPCLLETSIDGTHWCAFADLSLCIPSPSQPGGGTPQPPAGGGQQCYNARMAASSKWLLPTLVNTGDVIAVTNAKGAASDGTVVWNCPNGALFQFGACIGSGATSGGDPLNTSPHMMLIAKIGSVYHPMYNTSLTVPSSIVNEQVTFQVNDSNLADNYGDLTWDVCVTNNQAGVFSHTFDFTVSDGGFTGVSHAGNNAPTYIPGTGWDSPDQTLASGITRFLCIKRSGISSRTYESFTATYTVSGASGTGNTEGVMGFPDENGASGLFFQSQTNGNGTYNSGAGMSQTDTGFGIRCQVDALNGGTVCHAHIVLTKLVVSGIGTDPF